MFERPIDTPAEPLAGGSRHARFPRVLTQLPGRHDVKRLAPDQGICHVKTYGKSRSTTASPERVWKVWSNPDNWGRWNSGIRSCRMNGPLVSGATAMMETSRGSRHAVTFAGVEPPRRFTLSMSGPPLTTFTFICEIEPHGAGTTISQSIALSGPLAFLFGPLLGPQVANHFVPVLDDLAKAAEAS
jgi:uncharacterized protein YndB with AHSA1/START domain